MRYLFAFMSALIFLCPGPSSAVQTYAVAEQAVAVFNSPLSAASKVAVKPDNCGQVRSLEFVALPGTVFKVLNQNIINYPGILEVTTRDYQAPPGVRLYLTSNAVAIQQSEPPERTRPDKIRQDIVIKKLKAALGAPYVWGANLRSGVTINGKSGIYAGLDCSGLLYEATDGVTPRNTAELVHYGKAVPIAGLKREQIIARLKPLDLIVWKGHVVIVLDKEQTIESVLWCGQPGNGGVVTAQLRQRLGEVMARRKGADIWPDGGGKQQLFVVRRWLE